MRIQFRIIMRFTFLFVFFVVSVHCWRNTSGIKLGPKPTQATSLGNRGRSSIKIGKGPGLKEITSTMMTSITEEIEYVTLKSPPVGDHKNSYNLTFGIVLPFKQFGTRDYMRSIKHSIDALKKKFTRKLNLNFRIDMIPLTPSPIRKCFKNFIFGGGLL